MRYFGAIYRAFWGGWVLGSLLLTACNQPSPSNASGKREVVWTNEAVPIMTKHAQGFRVRNGEEGVLLLEIRNPQDPQSAVHRFVLIPRGEQPSSLPEGYTPIEYPIRSCICMTSLQLSNFIALDACAFVAGITSTRHLFNEQMNRQLKEGRTAKIGIEGSFDSEVILSMNPDVIFISPFKRGGYEQMKEVHLPLVPHLGYQEMTPLAQAEWVKLIGLFIGQEQQANRLFEEIEQRYETLKAQAAAVAQRPVVFSGEIRGGNWYAVGGKSFLAQLFHDAGADYFLKEDTSSGGVTLDFETVYSQADEADFWRIVNSYDGDYSYEALKASDPRYADFRAFKERKVLYCNMTRRPFYERMPMEPDKVLADMIHAFHPELLPSDYQPTYYELLK